MRPTYEDMETKGTTGRVFHVLLILPLLACLFVFCFLWPGYSSHLPSLFLTVRLFFLLYWLTRLLPDPMRISRIF